MIAMIWNMFTNETDGRIQMILDLKLMQDNVWQEIGISTLYWRPFSTDPLFGYNGIDLVAFSLDAFRQAYPKMWVATQLLRTARGCEGLVVF